MKILRWFFSYYGRIGRRVFILGILIVWVVWALVVVTTTGPSEKPSNLLLILVAIVSYSSWSLFVKRLHDMGRSGFWALGVNLIAGLCKFIGLMMIGDSSALQALGWLILLVFLVILVLFPGEEKDNAYGPRARKVNYVEVF